MTTPPTRRGQPAHGVAVIVLTAALVLGACGGAKRSNTTATTTKRSGGTAATSAPDVTSSPGTSGPATSTTLAAAPGAPDRGTFCNAAKILDQVPETQTPEEYERSVAESTAVMIATVPDRSLVPLMQQLQKSNALLARIASDEFAGDDAEAAKIAAEAEAAFPPADQERFQEYLRTQCKGAAGS